jgi:hypothetical protein
LYLFTTKEIRNVRTVRDISSVHSIHEKIGFFKELAKRINERNRFNEDLIEERATLLYYMNR